MFPIRISKIYKIFSNVCVQYFPHPILTFVVTEYGTKRKRPHYHGFIAVDKNDIKKHYRGSHLHCEVSVQTCFGTMETQYS